MRDNLRCGISAGGYGHSPIKMSLQNTFASNTFINNGETGQANIHHGSTSGDWWTANVFDSVAGVPTYTQYDQHNASAVVIFDPS